MPVTAFVDFLLDQLDGLPEVRAQRMFGGVGLYSGDLFFGIVHRDILYFKVNGQSRNDYVCAGMAPFKPYKDRPMTMQYYEVPAAVIEDADELCQWARRAIAAADREKRASTARRRKGNRTGRERSVQPRKDNL
jgi:DNA transformation protein and related proteins